MFARHTLPAISLTRSVRAVSTSSLVVPTVNLSKRLYNASSRNPPLTRTSSASTIRNLCTYCSNPRRLRSSVPSVNIMSKRQAASKPPTSDPSSSSKPKAAHSHSHDHGSGCDHDHSHGLFSTHVHDHSEGAEQIMKAFSTGTLDKGTKITLLGGYESGTL